ncbi:MAG: DUF447 family protein [Acidobacteria bacterium]|nr:DUF447 family protein [Acidobacteriota bacterium]
MIVETIFSTIDEGGKPNFAPMGVLWADDIVTVRPFRNTDTCRNLLSTGYGVANIADDVLAYARCALNGDILPNFPARKIPGIVFEGTCAWRELEVIFSEGSEARAEVKCRVVHTEERKDFPGFCRAAGAVIEAIILATRLAFYDRKIVDEKIFGFAEIVEKTGGATEKQALQVVRDYIRKAGKE